MTALGRKRHINTYANNKKRTYFKSILITPSY